MIVSSYNKMPELVSIVDKYFGKFEDAVLIEMCR